MTTPLLTLQHVDLDRLEQFAKQLVLQISAGTTFGLVGTLGAGKTRLVQAIATAAGVDAVDVTSPTFTLAQTHAGTPTLHHLDAYRIADEDEFLELGVEEWFDDEDAFTIVEWADLVKNAMPGETVWICLAIEPKGDLRTIKVFVSDARRRGEFDQLRQMCNEQGWLS